MKKKPHLESVPTPTPKFGEVIRGPQNRTDGWSNLVTGLGTDQDKRTASRATYDLHPPEFYEQLYASGGIPARIVNVIPEHALREWISWTGDSVKKKEAYEDRCLELDLRGALQKSWNWGRAYGGACLHIVTDTRDPSQPLRKGEKVIGLRDLGRWDLRILTTDIESDFASPNWGHPNLYYLNIQMGSMYKGYPIHWTRMIRFDGQIVPRRTYIRNNYWHDSVLNRIYETIRDYQMSNAAAAACLQDFNVDVYGMKGLAALIGAGGEQIVRDRIEILNYAKSVINAMIIDSDSETYENKSRSLEGVADLLRHAGDRLVAETDIPHTILLGESPDGSNATGNSTSQNWYNTIGAEQKNYLKPKLDRLLSIIFQEDKRITYKFNPLRKLDELETIEARNKQAITDKTYIDAGVLDPSEVTKSRFGGEEYSNETELDEEARESGLIGPGSADPAADPDESGGEEDGGNDPEPGQKKPDEDTRSDNAGPGTEGTGGTYTVRHENLKVKNSVPKTDPVISQTMSEPMRDPKLENAKPPGQPNKPRTYLPTRGNGVTAQSGFDMQKDAGKTGENQEGQDPLSKKDKTDSDAVKSSPRAACVIVKHDGKFLMGQRRDNGRWTLPGGMVEEGESMHQGGTRELYEETGIESKRLKFLGSRLVESSQGNKTQVNLYEHNHDGETKPTAKFDPDRELGRFQWVPIVGPLPEEISGNLQHPHNVALAHMGLI